MKKAQRYRQMAEKACGETLRIFNIIFDQEDKFYLRIIQRYSRPDCGVHAEINIKFYIYMPKINMHKLNVTWQIITKLPLV